MKSRPKNSRKRAIVVVLAVLLLALPIVPRHELCPQPLPMAVGEEVLEDDVPERPHPFAALQALKSGKGPGGKA